MVFKNQELESMTQNLQYNQSQSSASRGNVYQETYQIISISGNNSTFIDNPSEEVIFESNQEKEQDETMKPQNKEAILKNA